MGARNDERQVQAQAQQQARRMFLQAFSAGQAQAMPRDRFGNVLVQGMLVVYHPNVDLVFTVKEISPVVDPRVPPGAVTVTLTAEFPLTIKAGFPCINLMGIGAARTQEPVGEPLQEPEAPPPVPQEEESETPIEEPPDLSPQIPEDTVQ